MLCRQFQLYKEESKEIGWDDIRKYIKSFSVFQENAYVWKVWEKRNLIGQSASRGECEKWPLQRPCSAGSCRSISAARTRAQQQTRRTSLLLSTDIQTDRRTATRPLLSYCLQCFEHPACKTKWWRVCMVWKEVQIVWIRYGPVNTTAIPKPHHLLPH